MSNEPKRLPLMAWVVAFIVVACLITGAASLFRHAEKKSSEPLPVLAEVPDFHFITQEGKPMNRADLIGKVWIADFIFTRCAGPCPIMTSKMSEVFRELKKANDVRLISITIDPEYDTPEVLSRYASNLQADAKRWIFLTGPKQQIQEFTTHGMLQALAPDSVGGPTHSTRFLLVDKEGRLRKTRNLDEPELVQKLLMDIGNLLRDSNTVPSVTNSVQSSP